MIEQKQLLLHNPDADVYGDCFRTAIACLLDLPPADVPHFCDGERGGGIPQAQSWLASRGLGLVEIPFDGAFDLDLLLQETASRGPDGWRCMLLGTSRTGCNHVVIVQNGRIVWDPSLTDAGIVGPCDSGFWWLSFIVRLT